MKNHKRFLAVMTAATMLASSMSAMAADASKDYTGAGAVENNNATKLSYNRIVLPALASNAYDFTLDPTGMLPQFDSTYSNTSTVYFQSVSAPASIAAKNDGDTLYYLKKEVVTSANLLAKAKDYFTVSSGAISTTDAAKAPLYVWTPVTATPGTGEYTKVDESNVDDYFDVTIDGDSGEITAFALKANHKSEVSGAVCADDVYIDTWAALPAGYDVLDYITLGADGSLDGIATGVTLGVGDSSTGFDGVTAVTTATLASSIEYTAVESDYKDSSDTVTITNKSTEASKVTAKITLTNPSNLTFTSDKTFEDDDTTSVYFAIVEGDGTEHPVTKGADGTVSVTTEFELEPVNNTTTTYQASGTDPVTGGHNYVVYENPNPVYEDVSFHVYGTTNPSTEADWSTYFDTIAKAGRPGLKVVYSIKSDNSVTDDYKIVVNADGTASYTFVEKPAADSLTAVTGDGTDRSGGIAGNTIKYDDTTGTLTFEQTPVKVWLANASEIKIAFGEDDALEEYTFTVQDDYKISIAADGKSASYKFATPVDSELEDVVDSASKSRKGGISTGAIAYDKEEGELTFGETPVSAWLSSSTYVDLTFADGTVVRLRIAQ